MITPQPVPLSEILPPPPPTPDPSVTTTDPPSRILLIEDDPLQSRAMLRLLDTYGFLAHHVPTAEGGLQAVATQPPYHAILSDLLLPDLSGDELARRLRGPLLVAYTGLDRFAPWFDATHRKPDLARLLYLLRAPRLLFVITSDEPGVYEGHCPELGIRCRDCSPVQVLRLLARVMEERVPSDTSSMM